MVLAHDVRDRDIAVECDLCPVASADFVCDRLQGLPWILEDTVLWLPVHRDGTACRLDPHTLVFRRVLNARTGAGTGKELRTVIQCHFDLLADHQTDAVLLHSLIGLDLKVQPSVCPFFCGDLHIKYSLICDCHAYLNIACCLSVFAHLCSPFSSGPLRPVSSACCHVC